MKLSEKEILKEKQYLEVVKDKIRNIIDYINKKTNIKEKKIINTKKYLWDNIDDYITDDNQDLVSFLNKIESDVDATNTKIDKIYGYNKALKTPYFGKLNFKYNSDEMDIYIGIKSVEDDYIFYVYDWRSPIASMYYNYEIGDASYVANNKKIAGQITKKTQFKIVNGNLIRCFESNINIDDDYLQDILSSSIDSKMSNIVNSIQKEQNLVIRNNNKNIIVQGIAGSGKTSVAIHRIAYLLYKDTDINYKNILIFSPNDIFSEYISNVLPELGEENVRATTFIEYASSFLKNKHFEDYDDFLSNLSNKNDKDVKYKLSDEIENDINLFLKEYTKKIKLTNNFSINDIKFSYKEINKLFNNKYKNLSIIEKIDKISEYICLKINSLTKKHKKQVKDYLYKKYNNSFNTYEIYKEFLNSKNIEYEITDNISYEDITNLMFIYFYIYSSPVIGNIKYIIIDEVQDYTLSMLKIIKKIFRNASFTVLGDINQNINPYYKYNSLKDINLFDNSHYYELNKTYRSTEQIINYSDKILTLNNTSAIKKSKEEVEFKNINDDINLILKNLKNKNVNKIAIITDTIANANKIYNKLNNSDVQLITSSEGNIQKDIVVIPSVLVKGLEFEGVIVYNKNSNVYTNKNLFYVVCTRARDKLIIME